ncbi:UNVERIFIED_CONTAM: hypothetical protein BEN50_22595 [Euhalothece sp. KZN 001]
MSARGPDSERKRSRTKIDRVVERYGLRRIPEQLRDLWLGTGDEQRSTRELADWFNRQVLGAAIADLPAVTISGDVDQIYTQLQGEDSADRRLIRDRLIQRGVDIDEVEANFISHQTVYRYLTEELGVQQPTPSPEEQAERAVETVGRLRGRTSAVARQSVETLISTDQAQIGPFSVITDVQVICEQCGRSFDLPTLTETGGCGCLTPDKEGF